MRLELPSRIIIIEDEKQIRRYLRAAFEVAGFEVLEAENGQQGLVLSSAHKPDLLVIDLGLPDMDGIDVIRDIRSWSRVPIIVLSARSHERHKVQALDVGADDYLCKPFGTAELLARIRAHLRGREIHPQDGSDEFAFGKIVVNFTQRSVVREGVRLHLTPIEYRLLLELVKNEGKVLTHQTLLKEVWGPQCIDQPHYLRTYMGHLRQKLEEEPAHPRHLLTETGVGYRFAAG